MTWKKFILNRAIKQEKKHNCKIIILSIYQSPKEI